MSIWSRVSSWATAPYGPTRRSPRRPRERLGNVLVLARRLVHFWVVWSALLLVHEAGHAFSAWRQGRIAQRITVGVGPVLSRGQYNQTQVILRLVPVAGLTTFGVPHAGTAHSGAWNAWSEQVSILAGGGVATLALAVGVAIVVAAREHRTRTRCVWGRVVVADALVLTAFNFLPVPPLDGGRAVVSAISAWRGAPLPADMLFWVHVGGLALSVVPMALWTRWTDRIDAAALQWRAPTSRR